ncbi:unnamed protein product, partial [marine sediment metagenome]
MEQDKDDKEGIKRKCISIFHNFFIPAISAEK